MQFKDKIVVITGGANGIGKGDVVKLVKEPDNIHDKEAIKVKAEGLGAVGYVANSTKTVQGECMSAGRVYDRIGRKAHAKVVYVTPFGAICQIFKSNLK